MQDDRADEDVHVQSEEATASVVKQGDIEEATTTDVSELAPETEATQTPITPLNTPVSSVSGQAVLAYSLQEEFEKQRKRPSLSSDQEAERYSVESLFSWARLCKCLSRELGSNNHHNSRKTVGE